MDEEAGEMTRDRPGLASPAPKPPPRPFPAIDPEPAHRYHWPSARQALIALAALAVAAGAVVVGTRIAKTAAPAPGRPAPAAAPAPFADANGVIVFEQQPSGLLGTARPDGRGQALDKAAAALQGTDLPVSSPDGRHLITAEGELVTLGTAGPVAVTTMDPLAGGFFVSNFSLDLSFADGGRSVVALQCDMITTGPTADRGEKWVAHLFPTSGAKGASLGLATYAAGDPATPGAMVAVPVSGPAAGCAGSQPPDSAIALADSGRPARTIVTAVTLLREAGWKPGTPVELAAFPSNDGARLIVAMQQPASRPGGPAAAGPSPPRESAWFLVTRSGAVVSQLPALAGGSRLAWSPDGGKVATCSARDGKPSSVSVLDLSAAAAGGTARTITLPGRHDAACVQLLWSPDGTQLIYSALATTKGLTEAANLQHGWTVVDLRTGGTHDVTAPGQPASWLPAPAR